VSALNHKIAQSCDAEKRPWTRWSGEASKITQPDGELSTHAINRFCVSALQQHHCLNSAQQKRRPFQHFSSCETLREPDRCSLAAQVRFEATGGQNVSVTEGPLARRAGPLRYLPLSIGDRTRTCSSRVTPANDVSAGRGGHQQRPRRRLGAQLHRQTCAVTPQLLRHWWRLLTVCDRRQWTFSPYVEPLPAGRHSRPFLGS
jgi:hypothetical protein